MLAKLSELTNIIKLTKLKQLNMSLIGPNQIIFNQPTNIRSDAIALALNVLQMHNVEFTSLSLDELKKNRSNISNNSLINSALNILIFYKYEDDKFNGFLPKQHEEFNTLRIKQSIKPPLGPSIEPSFDPFDSFPKINRINTDQKLESINNQFDKQFI